MSTKTRLRSPSRSNRSAGSRGYQLPCRARQGDAPSLSLQTRLAAAGSTVSRATSMRSRTPLTGCAGPPGRHATSVLSPWAALRTPGADTPTAARRSIPAHYTRIDSRFNIPPPFSPEAVKRCACIAQHVQRRYDSKGMPRCGLRRMAVYSGISRCRGTGGRRFVAGFSQIECSRPSRMSWHPC